jgi:ligand-binding sensor domain-containing protein
MSRRILFPLLTGLGATALAAMAHVSPPRAPVMPGTHAAFTSTRYITSLAVTPDGEVWAGTLGGVLRRSKDGGWRKFSRLDGLPSHEARRLTVSGDEVVVQFPQAAAVWREGRWQVEATASESAQPPRIERGTSAVTWQGALWTATVTGLRSRRNGRETAASLPGARGTHISALLPRGDRLWAALFGDGLWAFDGKAWEAVDLDLPPEAREITAMAGTDRVLWLGTRRAGIWECDGRNWTQHLPPDEPFDHNCQALVLFDGGLVVSTLEDGMAVRTEEGWRHDTDAVLSSNAPRQMIQFGSRLYLRHGNGKVDAYDGRWRRDVCVGLPRKQATALGADSRRLYVAQWGGWSEFDGTTWTHYLDRPELQGLPITALCPDGDTLWVGTQSRGIAEIDRTMGRLRWHDDRRGLPDDWVTVFVRVGKSLFAGTFVGGLARWDGARWSSEPKLKGENVTALAPDGAGGLFVGTRTGVWHRSAEGSLRPLHQSARFLDREVQSLCRAEGGLWVGTRTGLYFLKDDPVALSEVGDGDG